jgi:hypothetical protein
MDKFNWYMGGWNGADQINMTIVDDDVISCKCINESIDSRYCIKRTLFRNLSCVNSFSIGICVKFGESWMSKNRRHITDGLYGILEYIFSINVFRLESSTAFCVKLYIFRNVDVWYGKCEVAISKRLKKIYDVTTLSDDFIDGLIDSNDTNVFLIYFSRIECALNVMLNGRWVCTVRFDSDAPIDKITCKLDMFQPFKPLTLTLYR